VDAPGARSRITASLLFQWMYVQDRISLRVGTTHIDSDPQSFMLNSHVFCCCMQVMKR
jgi:hypothetical protein